MITYSVVPTSQIEHLFAEGKAEGLSFVPDTIYIAAIDEHVVGYAGIKVRGKQATLRNLFVVPERRGEGIAKAMTARCLELARVSGATTAIAFSNWNSKPMYLSMGGTEVKSDRYYGKIIFRLGGTR